MSAILKWGGLAGSILLIVSAVLDVAGQAEAANAFRTLGNLFGPTVPAGDIAAAVLAGSSVSKKLWLEYQRVKSL